MSWHFSQALWYKCQSWIESVARIAKSSCLPIASTEGQTDPCGHGARCVTGSFRESITAPTLAWSHSRPGNGERRTRRGFSNTDERTDRKATVRRLCGSIASPQHGSTRRCFRRAARAQFVRDHWSLGVSQRLRTLTIATHPRVFVEFFATAATASLVFVLIAKHSCAKRQNT